MRRDKYQSKKRAKGLTLLVVLVLLLGCGIGGTLAWLMDTTGPVTNTFSVGDVNIELKEHKLDANGVLTDEEVTAESAYKIVPGTSQPKDPFVRVKANSEDSWIFVQVQEVNNSTGNTNASKYVEWTIGEGWTQLGETVNGVSTYYRETNYTTNSEDVTYKVLAVDAVKGANGFVTYNGNLTKGDIEALDKNAEGQTGHGTIEDTEKPKLIFKAFAVQEEAAGTATGAAGAADAWALVDSNAKLPNP